MDKKVYEVSLFLLLFFSFILMGLSTAVIIIYRETVKEMELEYQELDEDLKYVNSRFAGLKKDYVDLVYENEYLREIIIEYGQGELLDELQ